MASSYSYQTRNPRAVANPLRSIPSFRPASAVLGWTEAQKAAWCLERDTTGMAAAESAYAAACAALGKANRLKAMRRHWVAKAFQLINQRRAQLRQARLSLAASQATVAALRPASGLAEQLTA